MTHIGHFFSTESEWVRLLITVDFTVGQWDDDVTDATYRVLVTWHAPPNTMLRSR